MAPTLLHKSGLRDTHPLMSMTVTLSLFVALVAVAAFAGWRGARPPDLLKGVRMMPWRPLMVVSAMAAMLVLVHLVNLLGVHTGR